MSVACLEDEGWGEGEGRGDGVGRGGGEREERG